MRYYKLVWACFVILIITLLTFPAFSQEKQQPAANAPQSQAAAPAVKEEVSQPKDISIYGEVQTVNAPSNSLTVQYYDYDSDEEKTIEVISNKDTRIENAASLNDIKKGDWADVVYIPSDGKNVARSIVVEKEEAPAETTSQEAPAELPEE